MIHIIANPASQSGYSNRQREELISLLDTQNLEYCLHLTTFPGEAREIAATLSLHARDHLILVGGDGSIDEMVNGLPLPCAARISVLPSGSGNDFIRGMKLPRTPQAVVDAILSDPSGEVLDLAQFEAYDDNGVASESHRFAVSSGLGFDAEICEILESGNLKSLCNRFHLGKLSYLLVGIRCILTNSPAKRARIKLIFEDGTVKKLSQVAFLSFHNLPYEGGGFPFCPQADPTDGSVDVCIVRAPGRLFLVPVLLASLLGGRHGGFTRLVKSYRVNQLTVESDRPLCHHSDGEVLPHTRKLTITAVPGALRYCR